MVVVRDAGGLKGEGCGFGVEAEGREDVGLGVGDAGFAADSGGGEDGEGFDVDGVGSDGVVCTCDEGGG